MIADLLLPDLFIMIRMGLGQLFLLIPLSFLTKRCQTPPCCMKAVWSAMPLQDLPVPAFFHTAPDSSRRGLESPDGHYQA